MTPVSLTGTTVTLHLTWLPPSSQAWALSDPGARLLTSYSLYTRRAAAGSPPPSTGDPIGWSPAADTDATTVGTASSDTQATLAYDLGTSTDDLWVAIGLNLDGTGDPAGAQTRSLGVISAPSLAFSPGVSTRVLTVSRTGNGTVTSTPAGVSCGATCAALFTTGTVVDLAAVPDPGWTFSGWGGVCSGATTCQVTVDTARAVSATFRLPLYASALAVDPVGSTTGTGNHNDVFEPGESVPIVATWRNDGAASSTSTGTLSTFVGTPGASYTIVDETADYGTVAVGSAATCTGSGDCYQLAVTQTAGRPATHWDSTVTETLSTGETRIWTLHLGASFTDVAVGSLMYRYVETLLHSGTTAGCATSTYCPVSQVTRAQMAMFVARAMNGGVDAAVPVSGTVPSKGPYNCISGGTSLFSDVAPEAQYCRHVHYIASQGVTLGCTTTTYCPTSIVARSQMAMFISRAMAGGETGVPLAYTDPGSGNAYDCSIATPSTYFTDVPASLSYCKHVHYLWARSVIAGCTATPPQYCPASMVRRDQMAKFLVNGFSFTLYHP